MTEEQQAQMLAQWLEDPASPLPEGLDPEVIEALGVLRPDWVPNARVTVEDILNNVKSDPNVVDLEKARARRIPGWRFIGGVSGAGAMAAAALAWFTVFPTSSWIGSEPQGDFWEEPVKMQAEVTADATLTGASPEPVGPAPEAKAPAAEIEALEEQVAQAPPPQPRSILPEGASGQDAPRSEPSPQVGLAPAPPPVSHGSGQTHGLPRVRSIPQKSEEDDAMGSNEGSISSRGVRVREARKSTRSASRPVEEVRAPAANVEVDFESAPVLQAPAVLPLDTLRSRVLVHIGPMPTVGDEAAPEVTWIHQAKTALDQGQLELVEQHALHGLSLGSGPTAERRWLTFLIGESRRLRGDEKTARERFEAALRGEVD